MDKFMKIAKELSDDNLKTKVGGPFGACIVKDGKIIGKGSNHVLSNNDPTAHAEVIAIRDACKNINSYDLSSCQLYTSCYPCPICLSVIIKNLTDNTNDSSVLKLECIDREETIETFNEFIQKSDKTIYYIY